MLFIGHNRYEHPDVILASMHNKWEPFDNICRLPNTPTLISSEKQYEGSDCQIKSEIISPNPKPT